MWGGTGACVIELPGGEKSLNVMRMKWNPTGANLVLIDAKYALLAFP